MEIQNLRKVNRYAAKSFFKKQSKKTRLLKTGVIIFNDREIQI
jgi:hypothetical protein